MNCEKCQELLSEFLDGTLGHSEHAAVGAHLAACALCAAAREDFHAIIAAARDARGQLFAPTDERALWLRVREEVEAESRPLKAARAAAGGGFWSRLFGQRFELSLPQLAAGAAALVVAAASLTALGLRFAPAAPARAERSASVRRVVSDDLYPRTYLESHEANLRYWEQRVEARRASWNPRMRASFDRSVYFLDQSVKDSLDDLSKNPHDEVAEETLNAALRDKIELLREFGEQ
jgi:hypothetical protein